MTQTFVMIKQFDPYFATACSALCIAQIEERILDIDAGKQLS